MKGNLRFFSPLGNLDRFLLLILLTPTLLPLLRLDNHGRDTLLALLAFIK